MSSKGIRTPQLVAKDDSCSWLRARGAPSPTPSLSPPPALPLSRPSRSSSFLRFSIQNWKSGVPRINSGSAEAQLAIAQIKEARAAQAAAEAKLALLSRAAQAALGRAADAGADAAELAAALERQGARGA